MKKDDPRSGPGASSTEEEEEQRLRFEAALLADPSLEDPDDSPMLLSQVLARMGVPLPGRRLVALSPAPESPRMAASTDEAPDCTLPDPVRLPDSDVSYFIRYIDDHGFLRVFIHTDFHGVVPPARFRLEILFQAAAPISGIVEYPRHTRNGANLGRLGERQLSSVRGVLLFAEEE